MMSNLHWHDLIPSILFSCAIFWVFIYFVKKIKAQDLAIEKYSDVLNGFMENEGKPYTSIDIAFSEDAIINDMPIEIKNIADNFKKGYDFLHVKFKKDYGGVPEHHHRNSDELMYVLSGSLIIKTEYTDKKLFASLISDKCSSEVTHIGPGGFHYIPKRCKHTLTITEDTEIIIVARPPIFTRIGRLYEKLFKK